MKTTEPSPRRRLVPMLIGGLFKLLVAAVAITIVVFGFWSASSLAAYHDQSMTVSLLIGALCFPLGPVAWELWSAWRRARRGVQRERVLTLSDRLIVRTFIINLGFAAVLIAAFPASMFSALSSRGDWMLEGNDSPVAQRVRQGLFATAERLRWLHELTHPNAYEELVDDDLTRAPDEVEPAPEPPPSEEPSDATEDGSASSDSTEPPKTDAWPLPAELHPLVVNMPPEVESSYASVAQYIAQNEPDPRKRLKALHDYVADRLAYDVAALENLHAAPQDAETVFAKREAVCAGYAALLARMGKVAEIDIVVVVGKSREESGELSDLGHAWNAARLEEGWVLIDATWNAGPVNDGKFIKDYKTDYFMTPPEVFGQSHFPDDPKWQLREQPLTLGEFVRQPKVRPELAALGVKVVSPHRATVSASAGSSIVVTLDNPDKRDVAMTVEGPSGRLARCDADASLSEFHCSVGAAGSPYISIQGPKENVREVVTLGGIERSWTRPELGRINLDVG